VFWQAEKRFGFFWIALEGDRLTAAAYTLNEDLSLPRDEQGRPQAAYQQTLEHIAQALP
jgi:hypothetical protein